MYMLVQFEFWTEFERNTLPKVSSECLCKCHHTYDVSLCEELELHWSPKGCLFA